MNAFDKLTYVNVEKEFLKVDALLDNFSSFIIGFYFVSFGS